MLLPPGISDRSYEVIIFAPCLRLLGRYLFGDLMGVFSSSDLLLELPELDDKAELELEGTFLMLSKYLAIFSSVVGKVFLGM